MAMTSIERIQNTLAGKPIDYIGAHVEPWGDTLQRWIREGHLQEGEDVGERFDQDIRGIWALNPVADLDFKPEVLEETEETILTRDGNGAVLRRHKLHDSTPEHVDFAVKQRPAWEELIKPHLVNLETQRIAFELYRDHRKFAAEHERYFTWHGVGPFELMHPVCGHENMLIGMAEDPDWVFDMVMTFSRWTVMHLEELFSREGKPDGLWFFEDMGFKKHPFMSPAMYRELVQPGHKLLFDFAHSQGCPVIVHSCGYVEPLVPGLIEAGMDCLQAMEVKAGMDMVKLFQQFGEKIAFFGNIDVRTLISNDLAQVEAELRRKIPPVIKNGGRYILHTDHSEPPEVDFATEEFFVEKGRAISRE